MKQRALVGKIAHLPYLIRHQLNRRLLDGQDSSQLLPWLNALPSVKKVLARKFASAPVNTQNLSNWRTSGYPRWLKEEEPFLNLEKRSRHAAKLARAGRFIAAGACALAANQLFDLLQQQPAPPELFKTCSALVRLRQADQKDSHLKLDQRKVRQTDAKFLLQRDIHQRDVAAVALRVRHDETARLVESAPINYQEKIEMIGRHLFGDLWEPRILPPPPSCASPTGSKELQGAPSPSPTPETTPLTPSKPSNNAENRQNPTLETTSNNSPLSNPSNLARDQSSSSYRSRADEPSPLVPSPAGAGEGGPAMAGPGEGFRGNSDYCGEAQGLDPAPSLPQPANEPSSSSSSSSSSKNHNPNVPPTQHPTADPVAAVYDRRDEDQSPTNRDCSPSLKQSQPHLNDYEQAILAGKSPLEALYAQFTPTPDELARRQRENQALRQASAPVAVFSPPTSGAAVATHHSSLVTHHSFFGPCPPPGGPTGLRFLNPWKVHTS